MPAATLLLATFAVALQGGLPGFHFGSSVAGLGDVDGDGRSDVVAVLGEGMPGAIAAYSGRDGRRLWSSCEGLRIQRFSRRSLHPVGDIDRDGRSELAVVGFRWLPGQPGAELEFAFEIALVSGADGSILRTSPIGNRSRDGCAAIASLGDLDGDSADDLAVSVGTYDVSDTWIESCRTGEILRRIPTSPGTNVSARGIDFAGDLDGDGCGDLAQFVRERSGRAPSRYEPCPDVLVRSSRDGRALLAIEPIADHGYATSVTSIDDSNGDGTNELVVGWRGRSPSPRNDRGAESWTLLAIHSGRDGAVLHTVPGVLGEPVRNGDVARLGDLDGDGRSELLVSELQTFSDNFVRVLSGRDGTVVRTCFAPAARTRPGGTGLSEYFGYALAAAGDVDGDGTPDWVAGQCSPWGDMESRVVVTSGRDGSTLLIIEDESP